jgi:hypothetical protein
MYERLRRIVGTTWIGWLIVTFPTTVCAQTEGRVGVGGSVTLVVPTVEGVGSTVGFGPLVRVNPTNGWGLAGALNWFTADLHNPAGGDSHFARLRVRPLMAGIAYTVARERTSASFSVVAGPAFNSARFDEDFLGTQIGTPVIEAEISLAVRPGVSITRSVAPRIGVVGFAGYLFNRPEITYRDAAGREFPDRWNADALVLSLGVVYAVF